MKDEILNISRISVLDMFRMTNLKDKKSGFPIEAFWDDRKIKAHPHPSPSLDKQSTCRKLMNFGTS